MLELYQFEECEYSTQVRLKMSEWEIDYLLRNVSKLKSNRHRLKKISGQTGVPTLVDSGRNVVIAGDEKRIIAYLRKHYRPQAKQ
jgi:glutaredoxin 3